MTDTATEPMSVTQAIAKVISELPAIGKEGRADPQQGGYSYRGIEQITAAAQSLFGRFGVLFVPEVTKVETKEVTLNNKPWSDTFLHVKYHVYGPGGDSIDVGPLVGIGRDNSDKGANKAMTQCFKVALLQVLCIGDGQTDADGTTHEADSRAPEPEPPWWQRRGYMDETHADDVNGSLKELRESIPTDRLGPVNDWLREKGYTKPLPVDLADSAEYRRLMQAATVAEPERAPNREGAPLADSPVLQELHTVVNALPEPERSACESEIKRTFGHPAEDYSNDEAKAALSMAQHWPVQAPAAGEAEPPAAPSPAAAPKASKNWWG